MAVLDEPLRAFEHELGHGQVIGERLVERRRDHVRMFADRLFPVVGLFRTLVDEQDEQLHFRMVLDDRPRDAAEDRRLAGLRRRDDHPALSLADRAEQVEDASDRLGRVPLETQPLVR